jgi:hypothetical protein
MGRKPNGRQLSNHRIPVTSKTYDYTTFLKDKLHPDATYDTMQMELITCYTTKHHIELPNGGDNDASKS